MLAAPTTPKLGLDRMRAMLARLGDPQRAFRSLHVAGTKGKGSTCAFAEAMCRAHGLKTGMTISPHLSCARERIVIDGAMIDEPTFVSLEARVHAAVDHADEPSFFERMVAMAFLCFRDARVDVAVIEVGLGGRLDATNVITPVACAITRLGLDHTEHLGPTIEHIAREKAGIMKKRVPCVTIAQEPAAARVLTEEAVRFGADLSLVGDEKLVTSLFGEHQRENASIAAALVRHVGVSERAIREGAAHAVWPGRYEVFREVASAAGSAVTVGTAVGPASVPVTAASTGVIILDGAHNATAARALSHALDNDPRARGSRAYVVGLTRGHDASEFARSLGELSSAQIVACASRNPRSQSAADVARAFARVTNTVVHEARSIDDAITIARTRADVVVVTGSLYVVGDARVILMGAPADPALPLF